MTYSLETQQEDLAAIEAAQSILSAMLVGEKPVDLTHQMDVFARISGYNSGLHVRTVARMFWALTDHNRIDGFELVKFELLLKEQRDLVRSKLIRRRRVPKTCANLDGHRQKCYCINLANARAKETV